MVIERQFSPFWLHTNLGLLPGVIYRSSIYRVYVRVNALERGQ